MTEATLPLYHTYQLSNGLQIVGQSMPDFESVALCFYVRTGARDEEDTLVAGISHFLEHMIFIRIPSSFLHPCHFRNTAVLFVSRLLRDLPLTYLTEILGGTNVVTPTGLLIIDTPQTWQ